MGIEEFLKKGDNVVMTFENGNEQCHNNIIPLF